MIITDTMLPDGNPRSEIEILMKNSVEYGNKLSELNKKKLLAFYPIHSHFQLVKETLSAYYSIWQVPIKQEESIIIRLKNENRQRVILLTSWAFMASLSLIEYSVKKLILYNNSEKLEKWKIKLEREQEIHLDQILKSLKDQNFLDEQTYSKWCTIMHIRNLIVHNSTIPYRNADCQIEDLKIHETKGELLQGEIDFFVKITEHLISLYYNWIVCFISKS